MAELNFSFADMKLVVTYSFKKLFAFAFVKSRLCTWDSLLVLYWAILCSIRFRETMLKFVYTEKR